jgi:high-affinity Fe2+/Pb2+ permease
MNMALSALLVFVVVGLIAWGLHAAKKSGVDDGDDGDL